MNEFDAWLEREVRRAVAAAAGPAPAAARARYRRLRLSRSRASERTAGLASSVPALGGSLVAAPAGGGAAGKQEEATEPEPAGSDGQGQNGSAGAPR